MAYSEAGPSRGGQGMPYKAPLQGARRDYEPRDVRDGRDRERFARDARDVRDAREPYPYRRDPPSFRPLHRTPSPPRRFDSRRDVRDIRDTRDWPRDRDWRRGDYRGDNHPRSVPPSLGPSPPDRDRDPIDRTPRPSTFTPRVTSGPRSTGPASASAPNGHRERDDRTPFDGRDIHRQFDASRPSAPGSGPASIAPRAPRSMRGSSSPVELRKLRPSEMSPATAPSRTVPLPLEVKAEILDTAGDAASTDLEEGEVVSPVKPAAAPLWNARAEEPKPRGQWGYDRERTFDRLERRDRPPDRERDIRPRDRDRWNGPRPGSPPSYRPVRRSISPQKRDGTRPANIRRASLGERRSWGNGDERDDGAESVPRRPLTPLDPPPDLVETVKRPRTPATPPPVEVADSKEGAAATIADFANAVDVPQTSVGNEPSAPAVENDSASLPPSISIDGRPKDLPEEANADSLPAANNQDTTMRSPSPVKVEIVTAGNVATEKGRSSDGNEASTNPLGEEPKAASASPVLAAQAPQKVALDSVEDKKPASSAAQSDTEKATKAANMHPEAATTKPVKVLEDNSVQAPEVTAELPDQSTAEMESKVKVQDSQTASAEDPANRTPPTDIVQAEETVSTEPPLHPPSSRPLPIDPSPRVTIAERRAMVLPPTAVPLSSPFESGRVRRDPRPTTGSTADTNEADSDSGPRTGKRSKKKQEQQQPKMSHSERLAVLVGGIKLVQQKTETPDVDTVLSGNCETVQEPSSRISESVTSDKRRDSMIDDISRRLERREMEVARRLAKSMSQELRMDEAVRLAQRIEYQELQKEWTGHCDYLDALMAKRGPPPPDLYAIPSSLIPFVPPPIGPMPTTPVEEAPTRGSRRRGGIYGDAVSTEADFEAILAEFADDAAKDPNLRASKTTAVVPDMMTPRERKLAYDDENDTVIDPLSYYDYAGTAEPIWTDDERALFQKRYLSYPKQFGKIAEVLENKTAAQCVAYYYRTKKTVDYKGMLASKRGDKKKKGLPIKSSGKSSALLSNLGQQKPTVNPATTPGPRSNIIPSTGRKEESTGARRGKARESAASTPGVEGLGGRRKKSETVQQDEEGVTDTPLGPSRAGSETPSIAKSKMRMTVKSAKRPRMSSMTDLPALTTIPSDGAVPDENGAETPGVATVANPLATAGGPVIVNANGTTTPADLLPPMKRSGKRRKVDPNDPNAQIEEKAAADPARPGRRPTTNSYWSVEEKKKFRELVVACGSDYKAIAAELVGKSERQVQNFWEAHKEDMNLDFLARGGDEAMAEMRRLNGAVEKSETKPAAAIGQGQAPTYARSIYDVYSGRRPSEAFEQRFSEPRLGMFPPSAQAGQAGPAEAPQPGPRIGGMRISALLNDEPVSASTPPRDPSPVRIPSMITRESDAASDGTVSERDAEGGTMTRPSPRGLPPVPGPAYSASYDPSSRRPSDAYEHSHGQPHRDPLYRSSTAHPAPYPPDHSGYYSHQPAPARAATAAPALPPRQYDYAGGHSGPPGPQGSYYPHHSRSYPPPQHATHPPHPSHPQHAQPPAGPPRTVHPAYPYAHTPHPTPPPLSHSTGSHAYHAPPPPGQGHDWRREGDRRVG